MSKFGNTKNKNVIQSPMELTKSLLSNQKSESLKKFEVSSVTIDQKYPNASRVKKLIMNSVLSTKKNTLTVKPSKLSLLNIKL